jgi:hypothetical protein
MAGYVVLLILPVIIGVFIAAGVLVINGRRQRRIDTARTMLEARRRDGALSLSDPAATEQSSAATRRRIAS